MPEPVSRLLLSIKALVNRDSEILYAGTMKSHIHSYRWQPPVGVAKRSNGVYLLHGTGEHAGRYEELALRLAAVGWQIGAHDHPGHGRSGGLRGLIDPPGSMATQAAIHILEFANETGAPPIVLGHSLGGVLAAELVLLHGLSVKGLILSAPAFVPITSAMDRFKLKLLTLIAPKLCLELGYNANNLTHDEGIRKLAHADPLVHSFKSSTLVNWIMQSGKKSLDGASALDCATLLLVAGDDLVVDSEQTRLFASRVSKDYLTLLEYDGFYHELLNETPERRERVVADIENWLDQF